MKDRARRQDLNEGIERLRRNLVFDLGARPTKAEIVHKAADHMEYIQTALNQANDYIRQMWSHSQQPSPQGHRGSSPSSSTSSTPILMILVFLFGFFPPKGIFQDIISHGTMRTLDFLPSDAFEAPSALVVLVFLLASMFCLYIWYLSTIPYVRSGSAKHLRVQSNIRSCTATKSRVERRRLSAQAKQLLERDLPTSKTSIYFCICLESLRFIMNRLYIGRVLDRLLLLLRGVSGDIIQDHLLIQSVWYNSNNLWTRKQMLLESLRTINEMELISSSADFSVTSILPSLYYAMGHILMHRLGWFSPLSKWCIHRSQTLAAKSRDSDAEESANTANQPLAYDLAHMDGIDTLLQAALAGKVTESRQLCDPAAADLGLVPATRSYSHILKCAKVYSFYFFDRKETALEDLILLYRAATPADVPEEGLLFNLLLILTSSMWEKGVDGAKRTIALLGLIQSRFEPELLSFDPVLVSHLSLARVSVELSFSRLTRAIEIMEDVVDQLESAYMDPKAITVVADAVRMSLRLLKVSPPHSDSYFRSEETLHRSLHSLQLQSKYMRSSEPLVPFFQAKLHILLGKNDLARNTLFSCVSLCKSAEEAAWDRLQSRCLDLCAKIPSAVTQDASPPALRQRRTVSTEK
jgi:hypothetical protein